MRKILRYFKYLIRHTYYVRKACWAKGLYWQGLVHDLSKWLPSESIPYMNYFSVKEVERDDTGYHSATNVVDEEFNFAWLLHQKRNKHHWQWWILPEDSGGVKLIPMEHKYRLEMLCDWWGASMALGYGGQCKDWYEANKDNMQLHPETRKWVEEHVSNGNMGSI